MKRYLIGFTGGLAAFWLLQAGATVAEDRPLIDTHIHYSHDAWDRLPPPQALEVLRAAGLSRAFVSSSSDEGTQKLHALAPDFIVPVLRPYRKRGELSTWIHDDTVVAMLESRLAENPYAGIGEFHVFGTDADLPVLRRVVELAGRYGIFLHAHSDADAVQRLFAQDPEILIVWAHSGFTGPKRIRQMLSEHDNLMADLAFRGEFAQGGSLNAAWKQLFLDFPDRFMIGTDTYTPERWYAVEDNAAFTRAWLAELPDPVAAAIGHDNAARLAERALANWKTAAAAKSCSGEGDALRVHGSSHDADLIVDPEIAVGEIFGVAIIACSKDGKPFDGEATVDAIMPAHGHGMNNAAAVSRIGPGRFRADGLMFHMPGLWRLRVQLMAKGRDTPEELEADLTVQ